MLEVVDQIDEILLLTFDKVAVKLEHCEFVVDNSVDFGESDAVKFWINIYNMKSPMGEYTGTLLQLLSDYWPF